MQVDGLAGVEDEGKQAVVREDGADVEGMSRVHDLFAANEVFLDKVHRKCTAEAMDKLDVKRETLLRVISEEVLPLLAAFNAAGLESAASGARKRAARRAVLSHDSVNNAVWIRGAPLEALQAFADSARARELDALPGDIKFVHPRDRNGRLVSDCVSSRAAEAALGEYREACEEAAAAVRAVLRSVCVDLRTSSLATAAWPSWPRKLRASWLLAGSSQGAYPSGWATSSTPSPSASWPRPSRSTLLKPIARTGPFPSALHSLQKPHSKVPPCSWPLRA